MSTSGVTFSRTLSHVKAVRVGTTRLSSCFTAYNIDAPRRKMAHSVTETNASVQITMKRANEQQYDAVRSKDKGASGLRITRDLASGDLPSAT